MEWISVKDELPKDSSHVLCATNGRYIMTQLFFHHLYKDLGITHWMPTPKPPEV